MDWPRNKDGEQGMRIEFWRVNLLENVQLGDRGDGRITLR